MAIFGSLYTLRAQAALNPRIDIGLAYLEELFRVGSEPQARLKEIPIGESRRIDLGLGVFALEQAYTTKEPEAGRWESHRVYIDIQAMLVGEEIMGACDIAHLAIEEDLTPEKDLLFYRRFEGGSRLHIRSGEAAIFFPVDAHMPGIRVEAGPALVRKSVVKIPVL